MMVGEGLNKEEYTQREMKRGTQVIILILSLALILVASYLLDFNLIYAFLGVIGMFIILYFQKEIMRILL